ncbi:MAG: NAD-dependent epimerase/dehydratase family protein [Myxococcales bacterium]|nr:NAD-dependent epimerase/dehydratase family protein [Myxococcales bacterium]
MGCDFRYLYWCVHAAFACAALWLAEEPPPTSPPAGATTLPGGSSGLGPQVSAAARFGAFALSGWLQLWYSRGVPQDAGPLVVTGGAGFIGSRLAARLLALGHEVVVADDLSLGRWENLGDSLGHPGLRRHELDVCSVAFVDLLVRERPSRVFHFAANSDISKGTAEPQTDLRRTFLTTFHTLEAMRAADCRQLVFASTSAIYGEAPSALPEDYGPLVPISLYGASKLAAEAFVSAYCHLYRMRAWTFRFPNVVGPNLTHGAIYDFVHRLHSDRTVLRVLGNGSQKKPYLHVDDLLDAILLAVEAGAPEGGPPAAYNVAGEGATDVASIAELVREALGLEDARIEYGQGDRGWPGDVPRFSYDTSKIRALGWRPRLESSAAVRAAVEAEVAKCRRSS